MNSGGRNTASGWKLLEPGAEPPPCPQPVIAVVMNRVSNANGVFQYLAENRSSQGMPLLCNDTGAGQPPATIIVHSQLEVDGGKMPAGLLKSIQELAARYREIPGLRLYRQRPAGGHPAPRLKHRRQTGRTRRNTSRCVVFGGKCLPRVGTPKPLPICSGFASSTPACSAKQVAGAHPAAGQSGFASRRPLSAGICPNPRHSLSPVQRCRAGPQLPPLRPGTGGMRLPAALCDGNRGSPLQPPALSH